VGPNETAVLTDRQGVAVVIRDGTYLEGVFVACDADNAAGMASRGDQIITLLGNPRARTRYRPYTLTVGGNELKGHLYVVDNDPGNDR
jgi:hypothetical protein